MMRNLILIVAMLFSTAGLAEQEFVKFPWKPGYVMSNGDRVWSRENTYDSGFTRRFQNGAPEENGVVKNTGELEAELLTPKGVKGPMPFMVLFHGCGGLEPVVRIWGHKVAETLNAEGIGVLMVDSFTTRGVKKTCGMPDYHWGRRRSTDAYSALDWLIEQGFAKPDEVYIMGQSNGGIATMITMHKDMAGYKHKFAIGFPVVPSCVNLEIKYGDYYGPMVIFHAEHDNINLAKHCDEMMKKKRSVPIQLVVYKNADHGFMFKAPKRVIDGVNLSYNESAADDMMKTLVSVIKTKRITKGTYANGSGP